MAYTEHEAELLQRRAIQDPEFRNAFKRNYSKTFYADMKERLAYPDKPMNMLLRLYGEMGKGKSLSSLCLVWLEHEAFDFSYQTVFSKIEATTSLAVESYNASKAEGSFKRRMTFNVDETNKSYGYGSGQEEKQFDSMQEFLRKAQINMHILNPNDTSSVDWQLEILGHTYDGYSKGILYVNINKRSKIYAPFGYIVTKLPPQIYINAYDIQKDEFLKSFGTNSSFRNQKNEMLFKLVWDEMKDEQKDFISKGLKLGKDRQIEAELLHSFQTFNLPIGATKQLMNEFKLKYFRDDIDYSWVQKEKQLKIQEALNIKKLNDGVNGDNAKELIKPIKFPIPKIDIKPKIENHFPKKEIDFADVIANL